MADVLTNTLNKSIQNVSDNIPVKLYENNSLFVNLQQILQTFKYSELFDLFGIIRVNDFKIL
jgi:hypothetical protein